MAALLSPLNADIDEATGGFAPDLAIFLSPLEGPEGPAGPPLRSAGPA